MARRSDPLPQRFFARDVVDVARDLIGARVIRRFDDGGGIVVRLTEVEAYAGPEDSASHARAGATERTAPMFGPPGRAYVYQCYGIHQMLNVTADAAGRASAVLLRSAEVVEGHELVAARRGGKRGPDALAGPGKLGQALGLDVGWSHRRLYRRGPLWITGGDAGPRLVRGARVGIEFASARDRRRAWRFADADSPAVSRRAGLR